MFTNDWLWLADTRVNGRVLSPSDRISKPASLIIFAFGCRFWFWGAVLCMHIFHRRRVVAGMCLDHTFFRVKGYVADISFTEADVSKLRFDSGGNRSSRHFGLCEWSNSWSDSFLRQRLSACCRILLYVLLVVNWWFVARNAWVKKFGAFNDMRAVRYIQIDAMQLRWLRGNSGWCTSVAFAYVDEL